MKIYTIIGGVNGVGKSSFTGVLKSRARDLGIIVDVDKITAQLGGKPLEVAAYRNGELILEGDHRPKWIMELSEYLKDSVELGDE